MKPVLLFSVMAILFGCTQSPVETSHSSAPKVDSPPAETNYDGPAVARALTARYQNTARDCGSTSHPAFLCSGVVMRVTSNSHNYHAWNPSPSSVISGGVSFSYLRIDSTFLGVHNNFGNGFVFYPLMETPSAKHSVEVLCAFPINALTDERAEQGCGAYPTYPTESQRCSAIGITTAEQWFNHFATVGAFNPAHQCGFDVRVQTGSLAADSFYQNLRARNMLPPVLFQITTELRLALWPQDIHSTVPIEAFFYTSRAGLAGAQYDQFDLYRAGGVRVPIIKLTLPTLTQPARFEFIASDQSVD